MKIKLVQLTEEVSGVDVSVAVLATTPDSGLVWVPLRPLLVLYESLVRETLLAATTSPSRPSIDFDLLLGQISTDIIQFLAHRESVVPLIEQLISAVATAHPGAIKDLQSTFDPNLSLKPFEPKSFRDCALSLVHLKNASGGLLSKSRGAMMQGLFGMLARVAHLPIMSFNVNHAFRDKPIYYMGNHLSFRTDGDTIPWPSYSTCIDYELELGFVLASQLHNASPDESLAAIGGFVIINDFSARDIQLQEIFEANFGLVKSKNFATSISNIVITADEFLGPAPKLPLSERVPHVEVRVNNKSWGQYPRVGTKSWDDTFVHTLGEVLSYASLGERLFPGEVIASGTFPGMCGAEVRKWLSPGDEVVLEIEGIGTLRNVMGYPGVSTDSISSSRPPNLVPWADLVYRKNKVCRKSMTRKAIDGAKTFLFLLLVALIAYLALGDNSLRPDAKISALHLPARPPMTGPLDPKLNNELERTERLFEGKLLRPESCDFDLDGNLFCGTGSGDIVRIRDPTVATPTQIEVFAHTGERLSNCGQYAELEERCGFPLHMHFNESNKHLIVADAYKGMLEFDENGRLLRTFATSAAGRRTMFTNFFVITADQQTMYITDSSSKWARRHFIFDLFEAHPNGRLLEHNLVTGETRVLLTDLYFPNGIALSKDESFLLFAETTTNRILKFHLQGPQKGVVEPWIESLPGIPDNIFTQKRADGTLLYWVAFATQRSAALDFLQAHPLLKSLISRLCFWHLEIVPRFTPKYGLVVAYNENRQVVKSFHDPKGLHIANIASVTIDHKGEFMFLGSVSNHFLGRVKL